MQASRAQAPHRCHSEKTSVFTGTEQVLSWPGLSAHMGSFLLVPHSSSSPRRECATSGGLSMANSAEHSLPSHTL